MTQKITISTFALLLIAFLVYSTTGVFSKMASKKAFMSISYMSLLAFVVISMGVYAVLWQIILKKVALNQAFLFKSMTVLFSLLFASIIFNEDITKSNIIGSSFIIAGIVVNALKTSEG